MVARSAAAPAATADDGRARFRRLFFVVMVPMFLAAADQTLLATATPVITRELGSLADAPWLATAYLLTSVVTVPLYGRLGDRFGRRLLLGVALAVFLGGSIGCALATSMPMLVAARALQGFGGGGLMTLSQALIGEVVPPRLRARNQAWFAIVFTSASVGGPVIGGLVVHHASWRWLFWINVPLVLLSLARLRAIGGDDKRHAASGRFDAAGVALFAIAMAAALVWLAAGGARAGWTSPASLALPAVAVVAAAVLVAVEKRAAQPFLPVELLALPAIGFAAATVVAFASAMFAMIFYLPIYMQLSLGSNPAESGLLLLPLTLGILLGSYATGRVIVATGRPTAVPKVGLVVSGCALAGLAVAPATKPVLIALGVCAGLGFGTVMSVMQIVTQSAAGPARLGAAAATVSLSRSLGSAIGAAAFGALIFGLIGDVAVPTAGAVAGAGAGSAASHAATAAPIGGTIAATLTDGVARQVHRAFQAAFVAAATLSFLAAWLASRVPPLDFAAVDASVGATP